MTVQSYYVYPEQFSADRPAVHAMNRLSADIDAVLETNIPADAKHRLFQHALNRYLSVRRSDEGRRAQISAVQPTQSDIHVQTDKPPGTDQSVQVHPEQLTAEDVMPEDVQLDQTPDSPDVFADAPGTPPQHQQQQQPVVSPPLQHTKRSTAKSYAVSALENELRRMVQWDDKLQIMVDGKKYTGTNVQHIVEYLAQTDPDKEEPRGVNLILRHMAIKKTAPDLIRNKRAKQNLQKLIINTASPRGSRSRWQEQ